MSACKLVMAHDRSRQIKLRGLTGATIGDVLAQIGYPKAGHGSWRAWSHGEEIPLNHIIDGNINVIVTHVVAGDAGNLS